MSADNIFSAEDEQKIIDFVKSHEMLFDVDHEHFRSFTMKFMLWRKLAHELGKDVTLVKNKWKAMRDYFVRSIGRKPTGSTLSVRRNEQLSFLLAGRCNFKRNIALLPTVNKRSYTQSWVDAITNTSEDELEVLDSSSDDDDLMFLASCSGAKRDRYDAPAAPLETEAVEKPLPSEIKGNDTPISGEGPSSSDGKKEEDDDDRLKFLVELASTVLKCKEAMDNVKEKIDQILDDDDHA